MIQRVKSFPHFPGFFLLARRFSGPYCKPRSAMLKRLFDRPFIAAGLRTRRIVLGTRMAGRCASRRRGNTAEETIGEMEAPQVLQAVQQPVGIGAVAARFELPDPHEPRHAVIDRFVEQILKSQRSPGGSRDQRTCARDRRSTVPAPPLRRAGREPRAPRDPRRIGTRTTGAARRDAHAGSRISPRSGRGRPRPGRAGNR